jgi:hypothetical protein
MNNLEKRIERLEEKLGMKPGPREIILTNVDFSGGQENPYTAQLFPRLWAIAQSGGPFTEEEIRNLRNKHKAEYHQRMEQNSQ